jgi:hypothetical protein
MGVLKELEIFLLLGHRDRRDRLRVHLFFHHEILLFCMTFGIFYIKIF